MKKVIIIVITVLLVTVSFGYFYYTKIYMSDKNLLSRYLSSKGYICIEEVCTLKKGSTKYVMDVETKEYYISNSKYNLNIGKEYPVLRLKNGNRKCSYEIIDYKMGDPITEEFSYDNKCKEYIKDINKYIDEYMNIIVESNVKYTPEVVK